MSQELDLRFWDDGHSVGNEIRMVEVENNLERLNQVENQNINDEAEVIDLPEKNHKVWNDLLNWGSSSKILSDRQLSMVSTIERYLISDRQLSVKQVNYAISIWESAIDQGFEKNKD